MVLREGDKVMFLYKAHYMSKDGGWDVYVLAINLEMALSKALARNPIRQPSSVEWIGEVIQ
jgi:hypothetical protein